MWQSTQTWQTTKSSLRWVQARAHSWSWDHCQCARAYDHIHRVPPSASASAAVAAAIVVVVPWTCARCSCAALATPPHNVFARPRNQNTGHQHHRAGHETVACWPHSVCCDSTSDSCPAPHPPRCPPHCNSSWSTQTITTDDTRATDSTDNTADSCAARAGSWESCHCCGSLATASSVVSG